MMNKLTKEVIRDKAINLILDRGYNNVTINDICDACNITKPTFYKYVGSKDELILDLYDITISHLITDTYHLIQVSSHIEQLVFVFNTLITDTKRFGSDLFSQMLISNLNQNHHSFDKRESLTKLCITIIEQAQEKKEIRNMNNPIELYDAIAHVFTGYEVLWCINDGNASFEEAVYKSIMNILDVKDGYRDLYKKYI